MDIELVECASRIQIVLSPSHQPEGMVMLNLFDLFDRATDLFKDNDLSQALGPDLAERLSQLGTNGFSLDSLQGEDIQTMLDNAGIDVSSLSDGQISEIITSVQENGGLEGIDLPALLGRWSN